MSCRRFPLALSASLLAGAIAFAGSAFAADKPAAKKDAAAEMGGMEMPKAGPEHAALMKMVGKWNGTVKMTMAPGSEPMVMPCVEDVTSICNGMFIETVSKGTGPMPFEGHGVTGYDQGKKKYTGFWCDSWGTGMMMYEGTMDAKGTMTCSSSMTDPTGMVQNFMMQDAMSDNNTRMMKMWMGKDMSGPPMMEITYTRVMGGTESAHK